MKQYNLVVIGMINVANGDSHDILRYDYVQFDLTMISLKISIENDYYSNHKKFHITSLFTNHNTIITNHSI